MIAFWQFGLFCHVEKLFFFLKLYHLGISTKSNEQHFKLYLALIFT